MNTKLTLRLDENLITNAKKAAKVRGISLSKMVSDFFKFILSMQKKEKITSPILSEIAGILGGRRDIKKLKKMYKKHLLEKYQ